MNEKVNGQIALLVSNEAEGGFCNTSKILKGDDIDSSLEPKKGWKKLS